MAHVFISYSRSTEKLTLELASLLRKEGYPVWSDHDIESYASFQSQIDQALRDAAVVVLWSPGAASSVYV